MPIAISLIIILIIGTIVFQIQYRNAISNLADERMKYVDAQIQEEIIHKSKILTGLLTLLQKSPWIGEHLSRQDSSGLLSNSRERLQQVRDVIGITHLYFNNINRINILRVHNPEQSGDVIKRFTTVEAERTGKVFSGLELGSFGTLTLRVVAPWEYKQKRIGYVELGIDASLILDEIAEQGDTGLILAISNSWTKQTKMARKSTPHRSKTELGQI